MVRNAALMCRQGEELRFNLWAAENYLKNCFKQENKMIRCVFRNNNAGMWQREHLGALGT